MSLDPCNIAHYLTEIAARTPHSLAIALPRRGVTDGSTEYEQLSYRQLNEESDRVARALIFAGITRGMPTALMVKPGPEFFALSFAMAKVGAVPVIVDPGIGLSNIKTCLAEAEPVAFIGVPSAHAARFALGWGRSTLRHLVTVGHRAWFGGMTLDQAKANAPHLDEPFPLANTKSEESAAILFTSGSTGVPKGAVYTHGNFAAQVQTLRRISGIGTDEIDLPTLPVFALFDPALGMSTVVPELDPTRPASVDPKRLCATIQHFGVTNMFASPAVLNVLARYANKNDVKLPSLKRVICAGAPVQPAIMDRCLSVMSSDARIITPYGATEALPVCAVESSEILQDDVRAKTASGGGVLIGTPVEEIRVSIIEITDGPMERLENSHLVPQGQIGEILVEGKMVSASYRGRPESTKLAKVRTGSGFGHRMGDLGYFDEQGRLWFCGRKSHRVVTGAGPLYSVSCEMVFNTHPLVYRTALVAVKKGKVDEAALCVELEPEVHKSERATVHAELLALGEKHPCTQNIRDLLFHTGFPVDIRHNAKINREKLGKWAQRRLR